MKILDGGMGIYLRESGAPFKQPEWSALALIEAPETVKNAHLAYVDAGADIITTNSYALVPFHIGEKDFMRTVQIYWRELERLRMSEKSQITV